MMNDINIGPITIHMYGLLIALGLLTGYTIAEKRIKKDGLDDNKLFNLFLACMIGCLIGGKGLYCIVEFKDFIKDPIMLFDIENGFVIYGALIGGFICGYKYCEFAGINFLKYFEYLVPSLPLAQSIGRIGCFCAGCCHGKPTDAWYGIAYTSSKIAPNNVPLIPAQLVMSFCAMVLAIFLFYVASKKPKPGIQISLYIILYSVGRFFIEFLRSDSRGTVLFLSTSQFIAIFTLIFGVYLFVKFKKQDII